MLFLDYLLGRHTLCLLLVWCRNVCQPRQASVKLMRCSSSWERLVRTVPGRKRMVRAGAQGIFICFHPQDLRVLRGLSLEDSCWESGHMLTDTTQCESRTFRKCHSEPRKGCSGQESAEQLWQMVTAGYPAGSHRWTLGGWPWADVAPWRFPLNTYLQGGSTWEQRLCSVSRSHDMDMRSLLWRLPFSKAEPHGTILKRWQGWWGENHFPTGLPEHSHGHLVCGMSISVPCLWLVLIHSCETEWVSGKNNQKNHELFITYQLVDYSISHFLWNSWFRFWQVSWEKLSIPECYSCLNHKIYILMTGTGNYIMNMCLISKFNFYWIY